MVTNSTLVTGIRNARNVSKYLFGLGVISDLTPILQQKKIDSSTKYAIFFIDSYFKYNRLPKGSTALNPEDLVFYIDTTHEPTTTLINFIKNQIIEISKESPYAIVGIGGGITLDIAKAISNLLTNGGNAEDYQGWDLVKVPGIFKIGIPTISGTGAESTRTCVMTNPANGLKLGMNSDYTVYDQIILDPELTKTVPPNQYFYTGVDSYIHCMESLTGSYRNAIGDAFSNQAIQLCRSVFNSEDMMTDENRAKLMVGSYLGGCAIATSYVGVVHPFSAGLSVVLGIHHCIANCITMRAMEEFYPEGFKEFWEMAARQGVEIPSGICRNLTDEEYLNLFNSTVIHQKPLTNALGENFKQILTFEKVKDIFQKM